MQEDSYKETVKTLGKGFDLAQKVGNFIAPLIKGSLEQGIEIFRDKLSYIRWERLNRLIQKSNDYMEELGIDEIQNPIPLKFMIPLLQGASIEEDDNLQDIWIRLLVNSVKDEGIELKRVYIDILERISPLEVKILDVIYSLSFDEYRHEVLLTHNLPNEIKIQKYEKRQNQNISLENEDVELALVNLSRIGCVAPARTAGGGESFEEINMTLLGKKFYEACTLS